MATREGKFDPQQIPGIVLGSEIPAASQEGSGNQLATEKPSTEQAREWFKENFLRAKQRKGWNYVQLSEATGIAPQTLRNYGSQGISRTSRPDRINKIAAALDLQPEQLFQRPASAVDPHRVDQISNPSVTEVLEAYPELRKRLGASGVRELYSIRGVGGAQTSEGVLHNARRILWRRELLRKCEIVLDSSHAEAVARVIELAFNDLAIPGSTTELGRSGSALP